MADDVPQWDVPGWDWDDTDNAWLSSRSGTRENGVSIFFIHGGRVRHQAHLPCGHHPIDEFMEMVRERAEGLDDARVVWSLDTGDEDAGLWVEGTRPPNEADLARLQQARKDEAMEDKVSFNDLKRRHPDWFADET